MGSYVEQLRYERRYEEHKEDYELKTVSIKKVFGISYLWVKQSKYEKNICYLINSLFCKYINIQEDLK